MRMLEIETNDVHNYVIHIELQLHNSHNIAHHFPVFSTLLSV